MPTAREWNHGDLKRFFGAPHRAVVLEAAERKGLKIGMISSPNLYSLSNGTRQQLFIDHVPDTLSHVGRKISVSKYWSLKCLEFAGVKTPGAKLFRKGRPEKAWAYAQSLGLPVVVKPNSGSGGAGVSSNISTKEHFLAAWKSASIEKDILVEKHIPGQDHRLFVVGNSLACAIRRDPASVTGDGKSTIRELVRQKDEARRQNPYIGGSKFVLTPDMIFRLNQSGLSPDSILPAGQDHQLHPIANVSAGGESTDVTDLVHPEFARIAVRACRSIPTMVFSGVDLIAEDISKHPDEQVWAVIEVNSTPDIAMHHFPSHGKARDAAGALLDYLFS